MSRAAASGLVDAPGIWYCDGSIDLGALGLLLGGCIPYQAYKASLSIGALSASRR